MFSDVRDRDALFHEPQFKVSSWLETHWFSFLVPEQNRRGYVYNLFRTGQDTAMSVIAIWSQNARHVYEADYWDARVHLPMPTGNLDHYRLENGLEVRMIEPNRVYELSYDGFGDTEFQLRAEGINDPIYGRDLKAQVRGEKFADTQDVDPGLTPRGGHIDQVMGVRGELVLKGTSIEVDYASPRDHSWGNRPEKGHAWNNIDEGMFGDRGEAFGFRIQTRNQSHSRADVTNGYFYEEGELIPFQGGHGEFEHDGWELTRVRYEITDTRGRSYDIVGEPRALFHFPSLPNQYNIMSVCRWRVNGEKIGWGEYKWHWNPQAMQDYDGEPSG